MSARFSKLAEVQVRPSICIELDQQETAAGSKFQTYNSYKYYFFSILTDFWDVNSLLTRNDDPWIQKETDGMKNERNKFVATWNKAQVAISRHKAERPPWSLLQKTEKDQTILWKWKTLENIDSYGSTVDRAN